MPATKTNYTLILKEWQHLHGYLKSVGGNLEEVGMSAYLTEKGAIAAKPKGAKSGQDYIRYINKKSKVKEALTAGEDWETWILCQIDETQAKLEVQKRTGAPKLCLVQHGEGLKPRAVREPKNLRRVKEEDGGWGSVTQALVDALKALMEAEKLAPPELLEAGQRVLDRYAEQAEKRKAKKAGGEPL